MPETQKHLLIPLLYDCLVDFLALLFLFLQCLDAISQQRLLGFPAGSWARPIALLLACISQAAAAASDAPVWAERC
jgi:hypothetical protein